MKANKLKNALALLCAFGMSVSCALGGTPVEQTAGLWVTTNKVLSGESTAAGAYLLGAQSLLRLEGGGSMSLDRRWTYGPASATIELTEGTLDLTSSRTDAFAAPTEILAKAALWMDAGVNVVTNDAGDVVEWHDVREAADTASADCRYVRAVSDHSFVAGSPVRQLVEGHESLYFGGRQSGVTMHFSTGLYDSGISKTNGFTKICHAFVVHGVYNAYGFVLGGARSTGHSFGLSDATGGTDQPVTGRNTADCSELYVSRVYQNGELIDPQHTYVLKDQLQVQEYEFLYNGRASAFYNERFLNGKIERTGGDNLCEAIIFTNRLTEAERLAVSAYLTDRYLPRGSVRPTASVAKGAVCRMATVPGEEAQFDAFAGEGVLHVTGAGTMAMTNLSCEAFGGSVRSDVGASLVMGKAVPYAVGDGDVLDVSENVASRTSGAAKSVTKTGNGPLTLNDLPEGTEMLTVSGGSLVLTPERTALTASTGGVFKATVTDPSFENLGTSTFGRTSDAYKEYGNGIAIYDADFSVSGASSYAGHYKPTPGEVAVGNYVPAPAGEYVMFLAVKSSLSIPVSFPRDGIYELSFMAVARSSFRKGQQHRIKIAQGAVTQDVSTVTTWDYDNYKKYAFLCPAVTAGPAKLLFEGVVDQPSPANAGSLFDCVDLTFVKASSEMVFKVPGGDFEDVIWPVTASTDRSYTLNDSVPFGRNATDQTIRGWTFEQPQSYDTVTIPAQIGFAMPYMQPDSNHPSRFCDLGAIRYGEGVLTLVHDGTDAAGRALAGPFKVPAGTWRVRADTGWFCYTSNSKYFYDPQDVAAAVRVKVGDGAFVSLGSLSAESKLFVSKTTELEFALATESDVTLEFTPTRKSSVMQLDNVVLVETSAGAVAPGTTVAVPECPVNWTRADNKDEGGASSGSQSWSYSNVYGGNELCPGRTATDSYLLLTQRASASCKVTFPSGGRYRLTAWAAERHDLTGQLNRGNNPFEVWVTDGGPDTNCVGTARVDHDNWMEYAFLFDVPDKGDYTIGLQGCMKYAADDPSNNHSVRLDRVAVAYVGDSVAETVALPENLTVDVGADAQLRLDFTGTNVIRKLRIGGRVYGGVVSARTRPELARHLSGPGALYIERKGAVLIYR